MMRTGYQPYPKYQDSHITWIGSVPADWVALRFKHVLAEKKKTTNHELEAGSISFGNVIYKDTESLSAGTKDSYQEVLPGEFLINPLNMNFDLKSLRTALSSISVVVSTGYVVLKSGDRLVKRYARWLLQEFDVAHMKTLGSGVRQTINYADIGNSFFFKPTREEQTQIAEFLNYETRKIDALIDKQQQLIALLKEKRQAVISHTVTKGLNPNAPMRDSGVEWLGEVPAHWELSPLGYLTHEVTVGIVVTPAKFYVDAGVPCLRSLNVRPGYLRNEELVYISSASNDLHSKSKIHSGDVVVVRTGQPGTAAMVEENLDGCNCIDLIIVRRSRRLLPEFLVYQMNSNYVALQVLAGSGGAIQQHFNVRVAKKLKILVPSEEEQLEVVRYLNEQSGKLDMLIGRAEDAAGLLLERRTALISAAVTGKIDVRNWKAPESNPKVEVA